MTGRALISEKTAKDLDVVARFFGIDMEWSRHIFRHAAQADGAAFDTVMRAMAEAIREDARHGTNRRIRESIAKEKTKK